MAGLIDKLRRPSDDPATPPAGGAPATAPPEGAAAPASAAAPPPAPPDVAVPDDASRLCVTCAALLSEGQDWCLECGTAQPGRIGGRPGWRPALTIVAITAVLAIGAVAAAYAALSSDAERQASAPAPPAAEPVVPPAPVQTTPAPAETTPSIPAPADDAPAAEAPADDAPADDGGDPAPAPSDAGGDTDDSASAGGGSSPSNDGTQDSDTGDDAAEEEPKKDKPANPAIALGPDAASTFDPHDRSGGLTGDPADAIDGRAKTAWEAPVGQDGLVNIGLLISLDEAKEIGNVRVQAGTPGFDLEVYGSKLGTAPDAAPGATKYWRKLDATRDFGTDEKLDVGGTYRHVLLWFTAQPADTKVMIPELELLK